MRVLLIADNTPATHEVTRQLERAGIAVGATPLQAEGDRRARNAVCDVILLDQSVEGKDTCDLLRSWRRTGVTTNVLVLVAPGKSADGVRFLDLGADAFLTRTAQPGEMVAHLRALVRRSGPAPDPVQRIFDLEIDRGARIVTRAGHRIWLTPHEYALLELLARHQGRVVSRSMIREHLHGDPTHAESNVIDVYIRYLRNKLDRDYTPRLILTRRGEGYLIRAEDTGEGPCPCAGRGRRHVKCPCDRRAS